MSAETRPDEYSTKGMFADVTATFGGVLLLLASFFDILQGGAAVSNDDLYAQGSEYLYKFDLTAWGWAHIILGLLGVGVAIGILLRATWGQITGIMVASLSILTNFMFLPIYPVWGAFIIGFNVLVVWALCSQLKSYQ